MKCGVQKLRPFCLCLIVFIHLDALAMQSISRCNEYSDVMVGAMASQITSLTIVYSTVYSGADQRKYKSSASLALRWPVNSPHKWPVTRKMVSFDDVIMANNVLLCCVVLCLYDQVSVICNDHGSISVRIFDWPLKNRTISCFVLIPGGSDVIMAVSSGPIMYYFVAFQVHRLLHVKCFLRHMSLRDF